MWSFRQCLASGPGRFSRYILMRKSLLAGVAVLNCQQPPPGFVPWQPPAELPVISREEAQARGLIPSPKSLLVFTPAEMDAFDRGWRAGREYERGLQGSLRPPPRPYPRGTDCTTTVERNMFPLPWNNGDTVVTNCSNY
jgi:hypothetical protein